jgi:hypothetical protein
MRLELKSKSVHDCWRDLHFHPGQLMIAGETRMLVQHEFQLVMKRTLVYVVQVCWLDSRFNPMLLMFSGEIAP